MLAPSFRFHYKTDESYLTAYDSTKRSLWMVGYSPDPAILYVWQATEFEHTASIDDIKGCFLLNVRYVIVVVGVLLTGSWGC